MMHTLNHSKYPAGKSTHYTTAPMPGTIAEELLQNAQRLRNTAERVAYSKIRLNERITAYTAMIAELSAQLATVDSDYLAALANADKAAESAAEIIAANPAFLTN